MTITDEQIVALRLSVDSDDETRIVCDVAIGRLRFARLGSKRYTRETARARCAEIIARSDTMPVPRSRPPENDEERAGRERAEEDRFDYLKDEGLLRRR